MTNCTCLDNEYCWNCEDDKNPASLFWNFWNYKDEKFISSKKLIKILENTAIETFHINDLKRIINIEIEEFYNE